MKNKIIKIAILLLAFTFQVSAQKSMDIANTVKQISGSLPVGWLIKTDTTLTDAFIIQSAIIDLEGSMLSNDPLELKGPCEIYILVLPRISPDSISIIRLKNKELKENLTPQNSKNDLKDWYKENAATLKILDAEPTHYDMKYSYRIKCDHLPKNEKDITDYNKIIAFINLIVTKYSESE